MKTIKTRKQRVRKKLGARSTKPRLSVFVSNQHIYAQIIDDVKGATLASARDSEIVPQGRGIEIARKVGELVSGRAIAAKVKEVKFDRGGKKYHGRIQALAEGARSGGLKF